MRTTTHTDDTITITSPQGYAVRLAREAWRTIEIGSVDLAAGIDEDADHYLRLAQAAPTLRAARQALRDYVLLGAEPEYAEDLRDYADALYRAVEQRVRVRAGGGGYLRLSRMDAVAIVAALAEYECRPRGADGDHDLSDGACTLPALREIVAFARGLDTGA